MIGFGYTHGESFDKMLTSLHGYSASDFKRNQVLFYLIFYWKAGCI